MRAKRAPQRSFFDVGYPNHEMGRALERISEILDAHPEFVDWIAADVDRGRRSKRGRAGVPCEVILRCGILKQLWQVDYRDLEFALLDSASAKHFARVNPVRPPKKSALQRCIGAVRAEVWERINRVLMGDARGGKVEEGRKVRIDSTVAETHIRKPTDSQLLCDGVRVLTRLMVKARKELGVAAFPFHNHRRAAKRWALRASRRRGKRRVAAYRELLGTTRRTLRYLQGALEAADGLFEPHTDIIVKGGRQVRYGHKLNLNTGASGLVLDAVVEKGNPADSSRCIAMIERHAEINGAAPDQVACDAGYASKRNLEEAKAMGVTDVMFHKKRGLQPTDMASTPGVYEQLRRFRAGIEAGISYLKRCFGLRRCAWQGLDHFRAYVWSAIVAHNLVVLARSALKLKPT